MSIFDCLVRHSIFAFALCVLGTIAQPCSATDQSTWYESVGVDSVAQITFSGNRRIDAEALRLVLGAERAESDAGELLPAKLTRDVKVLYETGYFEQVSAGVARSADDAEKVHVHFNLVEKPVVRKIFLRGNDEVGEEQLAEIFELGPNRHLDKRQIDQMMRQGVSFYQGRGYYDATFEYSAVPVEDHQVDLTFDVDEGKRYKIREIEVKGLVELDEDDVLDEINTSRYRWWSSWLMGTGRLNLDMLQNDKSIIRQFFLDRGYLDGSVAEPVVDKREDGLYVAFHVVEGAQYSIASIRVQGDTIEESEKLTLEGIKTVVGEPFGASQIRDDAFTISEKFTDIGYAYANVVPDTRVNPELREVDLSFAIDKGNPVTINRINITGNDKTYDHVIRRELEVDEQELYSGSKVQRSQVLLERLGYFDEVNISTEQPEGNQADKDLIDLVVNVKEGATGSLSAGAGYSSSDGALFNVRVQERNVLGTGKGITANADLGDERENLILSYDDPRLNDTKWSMGIDALKTEREFIDFDRQQTGGGVSFGYPLEFFLGEWAEDMRFSLQYQWLRVKISDVDENDAAPLVIREQGTSTASGLTPRLTRNTINNPLNPSKGSRQDISVEVTGAGGNEEFYQLEARNQWYYPLWDTSIGSFVFSVRTKFGWGKSFDGDDLPLYRRYFPGGINSVRGFENRSLGPTDDDGNEFGGNKQLINNAELIFPLIESAGLKGVVFYDIGEAFNDDDSISVGDLREAYGYGFRWTSPLGPIRIEFGFPIDKKDGEDSMVTLFSFGAPL